MSLERAAQLVRERQAQDRQKAVDLAVVSNMIGDLAATAAVAKSRIDTARSGGRHWRAACTLAKAIVELSRIQQQIADAPPARRGEFVAAARAITELTAEVWVALRAHTDADAFGAFAGDPLKLANAVLAADAHARPSAKRSAADTGLGPVFAELLSKPKTAKR